MNEPGVASPQTLTRSDYTEGLEEVLGVVRIVLEQVPFMSEAAGFVVHRLCEIVLSRVENVIGTELAPLPAQRPVAGDARSPAREAFRRVAA